MNITGSYPNKIERVVRIATIKEFNKEKELRDKEFELFLKGYSK